MSIEEQLRLKEAEIRGILRLASRFRGKAKTTLTGLEMAQKVQLEADKLIRQLGYIPSRDFEEMKTVPLDWLPEGRKLPRHETCTGKLQFYKHEPVTNKRDGI